MDILSLFVSLLVACVVFGLLYWALVAISSIVPAPMQNIVRVVGTVLLVLMAVGWLLGLAGAWGPGWPLAYHRSRY